MIIDFHTHTFPDAICTNVLRKLSMASATLPFTDGSVAGLVASMEKAGITYSVNLPVMTSPEQVEKVNRTMIENQESLLARGIITFGGLHPDCKDYRQQIKLLKANGIPGIKLHPAYQGVDVNDPRFLRIFEAASEEDLIVLIHAGIDIGLYDHNYASVPRILQVLKEVAPTKLVLAHMGGWGCWEEVERDLAGAPVYLDTAFAIGKITPAPDAPREPILKSNLSDEAFLRIVRKHGTDRILFATDSPWEDQSDYVARIHAMDLTREEELRILGENAGKLLGL